MHSKSISFSILIFIISVSVSCSKEPEAAFHWEPAENPESGEEIQFINESLDANYYQWDFGNGTTSEEEMPTVIYTTPGDYTVTLIAENRSHSDTLIETVLINPPTLLEIYFLDYDSEPISLGTVKVFNTYNDAISNNSIRTLSTNTDGKVVFNNLEPQVYYVSMRKDYYEGYYETSGSVGPLLQNQTNGYVVGVPYYSNFK